MARAPDRQRTTRKVELDPTKDKTAERRRVKAIAKDVAAHPMERAAAIALLGKSLVDDPGL